MNRRLYSAGSYCRRPSTQVIAGHGRGLCLIGIRNGCREAQSSGSVGAQDSRRSVTDSEETHVKVRKALCAASVYPWSFLGQTCAVFGTLQSAMPNSHQEQFRLWKPGVASMSCSLLKEQTVEGCGKCRGGGGVDLGTTRSRQFSSKPTLAQMGIGRIVRGTRSWRERL